MTLRLEFPTPTEVLNSLHNADAYLDGLVPADFESSFVDYDPGAPRSGCILELSDGPLSKFLGEQRPYCADLTTRAGIKERVRLEDWYLRARLRGTDRTPASYMVLPAVDCTSGELLDIQRTLSCFSGYQCRYHVFCLDERAGAGVGFELKRTVGEAAPLPHRIQGATVHELQKTNGRGWHCLPIGWSHPFIDDFQFLLPAVDQHTALRVWNRDGTCYVLLRDTVLPEDGVRLADHIQWRIGDGEHAVQHLAGGTGVAPEKIHVELQRVRDWGNPVGSAAPAEVIIQCATSGGRLSRDLLGRLDDAEAGVLHKAMYYAVSGVGAFGQAKHYVRYPVDPDWKPQRQPGARIYVQYKIFQELGLPIFIDEGCRFSPDLRTVLDGLPRDHELVSGLLRDFSLNEDPQCVYLLRWHDDVRPSRDVLTGGKPLVDMIGEIAYQRGFNHVVEQTSALEQEVRDYKDKAVKALVAATAEDTALVRKEFNAVVEALRASLAEAEKRLQEARSRIESIRTETGRLAPRSEQAEARWNEIVDRVHALLKELVDPRVEWVRNVQSRCSESERLAKDKKQTFINLSQAVKSRLKQIESVVDECETLAVKIEESRDKAEQREQQSKGLVARASSALKVVGAELTNRAAELDKQQKKFDDARAALVERERIQTQRRNDLEQTRIALDRWKGQLNDEEIRLNNVERQIQSEQNAATQKKSDLESKRDALPGMRERRDVLQAEVKRLVATGVEQDHAKVTKDLGESQGEVQRLQTLHEQLSERSSELQQSIGESKSLHGTTATLRDDIKSLTEQLRDCTSELKAIQDEVVKRKATNSSQKAKWLARLDSLSAKITNLPIEVDQPKAEERVEKDEAPQPSRRRGLFFWRKTK